jgi:beta-galactosidase
MPPQGPDPGPTYAWPDINSHFGIIDIAGFPKDRFYWYKSWLKEYPRGEGIVHLLPQHWNWNTGDEVDVWAYSNADAVELFVNNQSRGVRSQTKYAHVEWPNETFVAGEIRAVAYARSDTRGGGGSGGGGSGSGGSGDGGSGGGGTSGNSGGSGLTVIATQTVRTTGPPTHLRASVKDGVGAAGIVAGCNDLALVQVEVLDAHGWLVAGPLGDGGKVNVTFAVEGEGAVYVGGGNGDPSCHVSDLSARRPAYHGLVLGVVRADAVSRNGGDGINDGGDRTMHVHVSAPGLQGSSVTIKVIDPTPSKKDTMPWWCKGEPQL